MERQIMIAYIQKYTINKNDENINFFLMGMKHLFVRNLIFFYISSGQLKLYHQDLILYDMWHNPKLLEIILSMQKDKEKNYRQLQNLRRSIDSLLKDFDKNRQWADFTNWLHRLYQELSKKSFSDLPQQINLCKRLAQCLNSVLPAGVHTTVLKIYEIILKNFGNKTQLLPLIALGLFPFFEYSNYANKLTAIKIFEDHFANQPEAVQMIVGLTNALLTGLNDNSDQFARKIYGFFDKFSKNYGKIWVDGAVWINILKSPKVRLAGFKYFMKVFKDRDKVAQVLAQQIENQQRQTLQALQNKIQNSNLKQQEKVLLTSLHGYRSRPDDYNTRFPNFSSLVVNTLCVCLQFQGDQMIKRSTLDLLITYLKLSSKYFRKEDGVLIVQRMLLLLQSKQYNLTNRVYKYLFDQPNSEGQFHIDFEKKSQELEILQQSLENLLVYSSNSKGDVVLLIIQIFLTDHPTLSDFLLTRLSFQIISFIREFYHQQARKQKNLEKSVYDFYLGVIAKNKKIFLQSIVGLIPNLKESINQQQQEKNNRSSKINVSVDFLLDVLNFYFGKLQKFVKVQISRIKRAQSVETEQDLLEKTQLSEYKYVRVVVMRSLITYIYQNSLSEKSLGNILDLCNYLLSEFLLCPGEQQAFTEKQLHYLEELLEKQASLSRKVVYAKLITLFTNPKKQQLLPYIEDSFLAIVCINILLGGDKSSSQINKSANKDSIKTSSQKQSLLGNEPIPLSRQQQNSVFKAIFKLLNCHLFQSKALQFIIRFRNIYIDTFNCLINSVEPSQWLIYWKKVEGEVSGGIIRMIENLENTNSYHRHISQKWITQSQHIVSKILDPIFAMMRIRERKLSMQDQQKLGDSRAWNIEVYQKIFSLIRLVFKATTSNFSKFFFLQREKYLTTFVIYTFKCIETGTFEVKSKSLSMLTYLLDQSKDPQQKFDMIFLTTSNTISILNGLIGQKQKIKQNLQAQTSQQIVSINNLEIQFLEYITKIVDKITQINKPEYGKVEDLLKILRASNIYEIILKGMVKTETAFIKSLYMDFNKIIAQMVAQLDKTKTQITAFTTKILQQLFLMLKNTEMNTIQELIKARNGGSSLKDSIIRRKYSDHEENDPDTSISIFKDSMKEEEIKHNLNLEEKYGEIIQIWNNVKFYIQFAIKIQLKEIPILNLISLILQSFPFSYLKYTCVGSPNHQINLEAIEEEISNITGLKKEVLQIFEILWKKQSKQILDFLIEKGDPRILVHSSLDPSKVIQSFNNSAKLIEVRNYFSVKKFNLPRNLVHYKLDFLIKQNQLLFTLYLYLLYFSTKAFKVQRSQDFTYATIQFLNTIKNTSHIQTKLWIFQLIEIIMQRTTTFRDPTSQIWNNFKEELQKIVKEITAQLIPVILKAKSFTHKYQTKSGLFGMFSKQQKQTSLYDFVKIFPPTIFQNYEKYMEKIKRISKKKQQSQNMSKMKEQKSDQQLPRDRLYNYLLEDNDNSEKQSKIDQFLFVQHINRNEEDYMKLLGLFCLKTLTKIQLSVLFSIYSGDISKISILINQTVSELLAQSQKKEDENSELNQQIACYLHNVIKHEQIRSQILKTNKKNIEESFSGKDFFKCTQKTLFYWKGVIDYCSVVENKKQIKSAKLLEDLLTGLGQNFLLGIFQKKSQSTKQKIKNFERVCFIIYSGKVDKYQNHLRIVLQSLNEVMKQEKPSPALLILILFCIRILFMRLSSNALNKLFRSVWPSLITLLIQIFRKEKAPKQINLQLAALKVIELIHALQLEEFMFHKWMFVFDYFGIKIEPVGDIQDNMKNCEMLTPFAFKPFLSNSLPNNRLRCKFMPQKPTLQYGKMMAKRRLIVKQTYIESQDQLKQTCVLLMQYLMDLNEYKTEVSKDDIQKLIEDDFISLDDYIFNMI